MKNFDLTRKESRTFFALYVLPVLSLVWVFSAGTALAWAALAVTFLLPSGYLAAIIVRREHLQLGGSVSNTHA